MDKQDSGFFQGILCNRPRAPCRSLCICRIHFVCFLLVFFVVYNGPVVNCRWMGLQMLTSVLLITQTKQNTLYSHPLCTSMQDLLLYERISRYWCIIRIPSYIKHQFARLFIYTNSISSCTSFNLDLTTLEEFLPSIHWFLTRLFFN